MILLLGLAAGILSQQCLSAPDAAVETVISLRCPAALNAVLAGDGSPREPLARPARGWDHLVRVPVKVAWDHPSVHSLGPQGRSRPVSVAGGLTVPTHAGVHRHYPGFLARSGALSSFATVIPPPVLA